VVDDAAVKRDDHIRELWRLHPFRRLELVHVLEGRVDVPELGGEQGAGNTMVFRVVGHFTGDRQGFQLTF